MLRGKDLQEFMEMKREGLSVQAISRLTGYDRKTVRKYLLEPEAPEYGPRMKAPSKLDPQAVSGRPAEGRCMERPSAVAGVAAARLPRRLHHPEGLVSAATSRRDGDGGAPL